MHQLRLKQVLSSSLPIIRMDWTTFQMRSHLLLLFLSLLYNCTSFRSRRFVRLYKDSLHPTQSVAYQNTNRPKRSAHRHIRNYHKHPPHSQPVVIDSTSGVHLSRGSSHFLEQQQQKKPSMIHKYPSQPPGLPHPTLSSQYLHSWFGTFQMVQSCLHRAPVSFTEQGGCSTFVICTRVFSCIRHLSNRNTYYGPQSSFNLAES